MIRINKTIKIKKKTTGKMNMNMNLHSVGKNNDIAYHIYLSNDFIHLKTVWCEVL